MFNALSSWTWDGEGFLELCGLYTGVYSVMYSLLIHVRVGKFVNSYQVIEQGKVRTSLLFLNTIN